MAHETRGVFMAEMVRQTAEEDKKDKRGEKFSSGLIDRAGSAGG